MLDREWLEKPELRYVQSYDLLLWLHDTELDASVLLEAQLQQELDDRSHIFACKYRTVQPCSNMSICSLASMVLYLLQMRDNTPTRSLPCS